jgi:DNA-binding SARP family transcriptional activator
LVVWGDLVSLHADLAVDLWRFERLVAGGTLAELRAAVALYHGEALPDVYDDWALGPRAAIHERFLACLEQLAEAEADGVRAAMLYRRLVAADPLRESAHVGLMRAMARAERPLEAL